jgi:hypothetical protein
MWREPCRARAGERDPPPPGGSGAARPTGDRRSSETNRFTRSLAHRDAFRHRRRTAGGRRQQLRRVPARGEKAAPRRRAAGPRRGTHPLTAARPGADLRLADDARGPARARRNHGVQLPARRYRGHSAGTAHPRRCHRACIGGRSQGSRSPGRSRCRSSQGPYLPTTPHAAGVRTPTAITAADIRQRRRGVPARSAGRCRRRQRVRGCLEGVGSTLAGDAADPCAGCDPGGQGRQPADAAADGSRAAHLGAACVSPGGKERKDLLSRRRPPDGPGEALARALHPEAFK